MDFEEPKNIGFTIYSKSGCSNCNLVKNLLKEKSFLFHIIDCDEYILENKSDFLLFIKEKTLKDYKMFPIIFYDGNFIGGYKETQLFIEKLLLTFDDNLNF
jgi:glutaredoxin